MEYILFLIQKNIEISADKTGSNKLILEKTPCKRGEVFTVDFGFGIGSEFRYQHYCTVISVNRNIAIVIPFTSKSNYGINFRNNSRLTITKKVTKIKNLCFSSFYKKYKPCKII